MDESWIGYFIIVIASTHTAFVFITPQLRTPLFTVFKAGFFNKVDPHIDRYGAVFFLLMGFWWFLIGFLLIWMHEQVGFIPNFVGWFLLILNLFTVAMIPKSGFWSFLVPAIYILIN